MFTATLYNETGFSLFNIPDSEATLDAAAVSKKQVPTMDILQLRYNTRIRIKAKEADVEKADYLKLVRQEEGGNTTSCFYVITSYVMKNGDTVDLSVNMEPILSAGGVAALTNANTYIEGSVSRHMFPVVNSLAKILAQASCEEDPMFIPSYPTKIKKVAILFGCTQPSGGPWQSREITGALYVLSSVDMDAANSFKYDVGDPTSGNGLETYVNENMVGGDPIKYIIPGVYDQIPIQTTEVFQSTNPPMAAYTGVMYRYSSQSDIINFRKKLIKMVGNGMNGIIQAAYIIPTGWGGMTGSEFRGANRKEYINVSDDTSDFHSIEATLEDGKNSIQPFLGKYNQYIVVSSATGGIKEFNVEEALLLADSSLGNPPKIVIPVNGDADPRPDGGVRFAVGMKGNDYGGSAGQISLRSKYDIIDGGKWYQMPISTIGQADYITRRRAFNASQETADLQADIASVAGLESYKNTANPIKKLGAAVNDADQRVTLAGLTHESQGTTYQTGSFTGGYSSYNPGGTGYVANSGYGEGILAGNERIMGLANREIERYNEFAQFTAANAPHPHVVTSANGELDPYGNALVVFKRELDERDYNKFQKLISMFGVKHTTPFEKSFLNNRKYWNYIEGSGMCVNIQGQSKEMNLRVSEALNGGVRIWHRKPAAWMYGDSNPAPDSNGGN